MSKLETAPILSDGSEHNLDQWAESLIERHGHGRLSLIPYDSTNPYHSPDFLKAEPDNPSIEDASLRGQYAVGVAEFGPFFGDIKRLPDNNGHPYGAMRQIKSRLGVKNHHTALITNHADLMDLPLAQTGLFRALEDDGFGSQSAIIVSRAMTRLAYDGIPVVDILRKSGAVYFTMPRTASAAEYSITEEEAVAFNRRMGRQLAYDLKQLGNQGKSMLLAVSLTGKTIAKSDRGLEMPALEPTTCKLVLSRFKLALPISMYLSNIAQGKEWYHLHTPEMLGSMNDIEQLMRQLTLDTVDLSGEDISYSGRKYLGRVALRKRAPPAEAAATKQTGEFLRSVRQLVRSAINITFSKHSKL